MISKGCAAGGVYILAKLADMAGRSRVGWDAEVEAVAVGLAAQVLSSGFPSGKPVSRGCGGTANDQNMGDVEMLWPAAPVG